MSHNSVLEAGSSETTAPGLVETSDEKSKRQTLCEMGKAIEGCTIYFFVEHGYGWIAHGETMMTNGNVTTAMAAALLLCRGLETCL